MPDEIFRIESRVTERGKRAQTAQHVIAALTLISNGWAHVTAVHAHHTTLSIFEIAAGAVLIIAVIIEKVRHSRGSHSSVGWVELAGAAMLFVEAVTRLFEPHTLALRILSFVPPIILLLFGLFDVRLQQMPHLRATDDDFRMRIRFIRRKRVKWSDVRTARADNQSLIVERNDGGTTRFRMRELKNPEAAMSWALEQFRRRGLAAE
jgi:hypothetical protein